ncbi:MAG: response regulator [Firmicutes bacterium]|nr:response regulator [Bacillota bacterium]
MHFQYNPHIWFYLSGALLLAFVMLYEIRKEVANRLLIITQGMMLFWGLGSALQISGADLKTTVLWYLLANDFVGFKIPVVWLLWALVVSGRRSWVTRRHILLLLALPLLTDLLNLTNSRHGLMYRQWWLNTSGSYPLLEFLSGPWYWVITAYCGVLLLVVIAFQIKAVLKRELLHRRHALMIAGFTGGVLLLILLSLLRPGLVYPYDPTPVVVSMASVLSGLFTRFQSQEPVPVPRNAVLEKMANAVIILDNHNRIMDLNPAAEAFFSFRSAEVAGCVFSEVIQDWPELVNAVQDQPEGSREFTRNGRYYEVHFSVLQDRQKPVGRLVVIEDVTTAKSVEKELLEQKQALLVLKERERLARELHDSLGQVLSYTQMQIEEIRERLKTGELTTADDHLVRLSQVILEANTEVREFIYEVNATLLFKDGFFSTLQRYLARFEENFRLRIRVRNPDNVVEEEIDLAAGVQLFRIIQEALTNVRKHAKACEVTITFRREKEWLQIFVVDDGIGFDPKKLPSSRSTFGLEVMKERAAQVGGDLRIETAPGQGVAVVISIPRFTLDQDRTKPGTGGHVKTRKPGTEAGGRTRVRVLLADDHVLFMEGLRDLINRRGFEVVGTAKDGMEALIKARLLRPDMILMDLQMPRCNGLTATKLIKEEMPEIKIVILTMSDREQDLLEAIRSGATGYLLKGLQTEEFVEQLTSLALGGETISPEAAARVLEEAYQNGDRQLAAPVTNPEKILSPRQIEILQLVVKGNTYKEVAAKLFVSERTIKYQMAAIIKQLNLKNRAQAIAYARQAGLVKK